jgi:hypothetical protein
MEQVAAIANASSLLVSIGWDRFGLAPEVWTVIVLLLGTGLCIHGDDFYAKTHCWG